MNQSKANPISHRERSKVGSLACELAIAAVNGLATNVVFLKSRAGRGIATVGKN
jgi:hypothetical protein